MLLALSALGFARTDQCDGPLDCNGKNCFECSCTDHQCQCADGWSGPHCETPFCNSTSGCSGHGSCVMKARSISCACDAGWAGPHCETAVCALVCVHGGAPDKGCTTCEGCRGAWGGKLCDTWNASFPASSVQLQLSALKNASQAALQESLKYTPICKQGQECVGWGVDLGAGATVNYPLLTLNFSGSTPSWSGLKYPAGTSVVPSQSPGFAVDEPRVLLSGADHFNYVEGLWSEQQGRAGWYSKPAASVTRIFDDPKDWYPSVTQAVYELYHMTIDPDPTSKSGYAPKMDAAALAALQTVGPTYEQDPLGWETFFENWGTSVVLESHSGGMLQFVSFASTVIPLTILAGKDDALAQMQAQAAIVLTNATGLGGHSGTPDPTFSKYSFPDSHLYAVFGGDPTKAPIAARNRSAWFESLKAAQVLTSFKLAPLSVFVDDAALATSLEDATHAYLTQQRTQWANVTHCPPTCNGHGNCSSGTDTCECSWCQYGRQCSTAINCHYYGDPAFSCAPDEEAVDIIGCDYQDDCPLANRGKHLGRACGKQLGPPGESVPLYPPAGQPRGCPVVPADFSRAVPTRMGYQTDCTAGKYGVTCAKRWCFLACGGEVHGGGGTGYPPIPDPGGTYNLPNHGCPAGSVCSSYFYQPPGVPHQEYYHEWMCVFNESTPALGAGGKGGGDGVGGDGVGDGGGGVGGGEGGGGVGGGGVGGGEGGGGAGGGDGRGAGGGVGGGD